jgi:hypothetical protein
MALALALAAWGCTPCPPCEECEECPPTALGAASTDPTVTLVTIGSDMAVSPLSPVISKGGNGGIQWHNAGTEATVITLIGSPVTIELPGGGYSTVYRLSEGAAVGMNVDYTVKRGLSGPPDPPNFSVGP